MPAAISRCVFRSWDDQRQREEVGDRREIPASSRAIDPAQREQAAPTWCPPQARRNEPDTRQQGCALPADPPKVEEIVAVMRAAGDGPHGRRLYLQGIDNGEIIDTVHSRHAPMVPVSASLRL
jgi:hypothetical protein